MVLSLCLVAEPAAAQSSIGTPPIEPGAATEPSPSSLSLLASAAESDPSDAPGPQVGPSSDNLIVSVAAPPDWRRLFPRLIEKADEGDDCGDPTSRGRYLDFRWLASCFGRDAVPRDSDGSNLQLAVGSMSELSAGIERANRIFFQQGYVNSGVRIEPAPAPATGYVLHVVAGRVGWPARRDDFVTCRLSPARGETTGITHRYVERRLMRGCDPDRPFNVYLLELDFRRLADDRERWIDRINTRLEPVPGEDNEGLATLGEAPSGEGRMIERYPPVDLTVGVANDRSPSIGSVRSFAAATLRGPAGSLVDAEIGSTEGALDAATTLSLAVAPRWTATVRGEIDEAEIVDPILRPLDIRSRGWGGEASLIFNPINCPLTPLFGSPTARVPRQAFSHDGLESAPSVPGCRATRRLPGARRGT